MKKILSILFVLIASGFAHAHVGSPDVYYEGDAGPYHLFVTVRLPQVVPGIAEMQVRSASPDVQNVQVVLLRLTGPGSNLPSIPDVARRSKDDPQFFVSNLWFMEFGALQVRIDVDGAKGKAQLSVPVASFARQALSMSQGMRSLGALFLVLLTLSVVPISGAIIRYCTVTPGENPQAANKRRSWTVMAIVMMVAVVLLYLNRALWNEEASTYNRSVELLKPPRAETKLMDGNRLVIRPATQLLVPVAGMGRTTREVKMEEVIPDHGHVMHLFLIGMPGMEKMWHLHPDRAEDGSFAVRLPEMPAGKYQLFADIVDKNGFPWTLVADMDLPHIAGSPLSGDDSDWTGDRLTTPLLETTIARLPDEARIVWERDDLPLKANSPASFKFRVEGKDGLPARDLEPYMGMAGHAEIVCSDLSVFAHIHPNGSVSMAALDLAQAGLMTQPAPGGPTMAMAMEMARSSSKLPSELSFPYGFPHAGDYRIFVQIKRSGRVQTVAFDAHVQ